MWRKKLVLHKRRVEVFIGVKENPIMQLRFETNKGKERKKKKNKSLHHHSLPAETCRRTPQIGEKKENRTQMLRGVRESAGRGWRFH